MYVCMYVGLCMSILSDMDRLAKDMKCQTSH